MTTSSLQGGGFPDSSACTESIHLQCKRPQFDSWVGKTCWKGIGYPLQYSWASLVAQLAKNPFTMPETWIQSLGWEDPLEKVTNGYPLQYCGLKNSMDCRVHGVAKSQIWLSNFHFHSLQGRSKAAVPNSFGTWDQFHGRQSSMGLCGRMQVMGSSCKYRWSSTYSPAAHLLLWGPVPNRPQTNVGPWPGGLGSLG